MNETIRQLVERKSMRMFTDREIPEEARLAILEAASQAPTAGNQQLYTILDITDQSLKDALALSCDDQPMIASAKWVLIFCADCKKWYDAYLSVGAEPRKPGTGDFLLAVCDAVIAAQNAVTAAQSLGIGSCYVGDVMENYETQRELLKLPDYVFPAAMLIFGYPTDGQNARKKPRRAELRHVVHKNGYRELSPGELREMWEPRCGDRSYEEWMTAFCTRKYNSAFSREMTRSVEEFLKQFSQD